MTKFTIKNYLIHWIKIWPITLVFVLIGAGFGMWASNGLVQSYKSSATIIIVNPTENVVSGDYTTLMNSVMILTDAREKSGASDECTLLATGIGNVLNVTSDCSSSGEDSEKLLAEGITVFEKTAKEIYEDDSITVTKVSGNIGATETVTDEDHVFKFVVPIFAAVVLSVIVAFIWLDYDVNKSKKK